VPHSESRELTLIVRTDLGAPLPAADHSLYCACRVAGHGAGGHAPFASAVHQSQGVHRTARNKVTSGFCRHSVHKP
jgi:hypothetical protein